MKTADYLNFIVNEIHTTVVATTDECGLPVTCAVDMMYSDGKKLYFLTAKSKKFYDRLKKSGFLAFTGVKGKDTMSSVSLSVCGKVRETDAVTVKELCDKNPYMYEIYPDESSLKGLAAFEIYEGTGDLFDLSQKPIGRAKFEF